MFNLLIYKSCLMNGASLEDNRNLKKFSRIWKKFLTNDFGSARIAKLLIEQQAIETPQINLKKLEKSTWQMEVSMIEWASWPADAAKRTVPCKLNNVKTNYNTLDN